MPEAAGHASAVVFLHGVGGAARAWAPQMQSFPRAGFAPMALDLPGVGHLPNLERPAAFAAAVVEFLRSVAGVEAPLR